MAEPKKKKQTASKKRGPKLEHLKLKGDWQAAIKKVLKKGKPPSRKK